MSWIVLAFVLASSADSERATRPLFRGAGTGSLNLVAVPEKVPVEFYLVQCTAAAPGDGVFSVSRSGEKARPGTVAVGQLYTESTTGVTFRIDGGDREFAPGDSFSFATFSRKEELDKLFDDWVNRYVKWIISREERDAYSKIAAPEEKLAFIEAFWRRRDPTPETPRNERREEHQRRYAYVLQHFGAGIPGWATDRGKIYILLGPPHSIERNPTGRTSFERPSEVWTYNNPPNPRLPASLDIAFVDFTATGRYEIVSATNLDILAPLRTNIGYAMSELEAIGLLRSGGDVMDQTTGLRTPVDPTRMVTEQFDFQQELREVARVPDLARPSLKESIEATTAFPSLPLVASAAYFPDASPVTLALPYARLTPVRDGTEYRFQADVLLRFAREGAAQEPAIEDRIDVRVPESELAAYREHQLLYETSLSLPPGRYTVEAFLRDVPSGAWGRASATLDVPERSSTLTVSSVVLATGSVEVPAGATHLPFQFGSLRLLPNPEGRFVSGSTLTAYFQVFGYRAEAPRLRVQYFIQREGRLYSKVAPSEHRPAAREQTGIKSEISLKGFPAGRYRLRARVTDEVSGAVAERDADFTVEPAR